jgi:DNA polymerase-4
MDSYFATVEQQANPHLRGKPIVVSGKEDSRTVIVAASREAKKFGVKTAMAIFEAKKLCPNLVFVFPDGDKYQETTDRFITIFKRFTDMVEIYSIDEAFLDMTGHVKTYGGAKAVGLQIKQAIRDEVGEWVSCSIGIAPNKLVAKIASDLDKPDGLVVLEKQAEIIKMLDQLKLTDVWGIGPRIARRLVARGVDSIPRLRQYPEKALMDEFGPFYGKLLKNMSVGKYDGEVVSYLHEEEVKSVGRSYTLPQNTYDKREIFHVLLLLSERCGRRLRSKGLAGKTLHYYVRYDDFTHGGRRMTVARPINDELVIYNNGVELLQKMRLTKAVRLVGVRVSNLFPTPGQRLLWPEEQKRQDVLPYLDEINDKYGSLTIKSGFLTDARRLRRKVGGFKYDSE